MSAHTVLEAKESRESGILKEIRDSEKKADEIIENAKLQRDTILQEASKNSSKILAEKEEEIRKKHEKKISDFRETMKFLKEDKLAEGKNAVRQMKAKTEKNSGKAVEFVIEKFEEML